MLIFYQAVEREMRKRRAAPGPSSATGAAERARCCDTVRRDVIVQGRLALSLEPVYQRYVYIPMLVRISFILDTDKVNHTSFLQIPK